MGWVWLDGVRNFEKAKRVEAWKKWESRFPEGYLVEMVAQAGALLLGAETDFQSDVVFIKIEGFEFLKRPVDGKRLEIEAETESLRREAGWFNGQIHQNGEPVARGRVLLMNVGRLRPDGKGPITFPRPLLEGLKLKCPSEE